MGFATRVWYAAGRMGAGDSWRTGTGRTDASHCFVVTKFAFASSVTVQLILAAKRAFPIAPDCLSAVRVVGLLNNPRMGTGATGNV